MAATAATQSITLPVLGKKNSDWEQGLQHAADWARDVQHARKAYPELDNKLTLYLKQCTVPGALSTLNALIEGKNKDPLDEDYPDDLNLTSTTAANVRTLTEYHDEWFELLIAACAEDEQLQLVRQIANVPFPKPVNGRYTSRQITPFIAELHTLFNRFTEEQRQRIDGSKEVRDAVYRQLPISL